MTSTKTLLATFFLIALSCKKENTALQSSGSSDESTIQTLVTDVNDPAANAVRIGNQVWMTRNLNVTRYRNGDPIPQVKNPAKWASLTTGAWCWYENNSANGPKYGRLYNWYAVNDSRGLAPKGFHVPSSLEWESLVTNLGGKNSAAGKLTDIAGKKLKSNNGWLEGGDGTNESGFFAIPGGARNDFGDFDDIGYSAIWWTSTQQEVTIGLNSIVWYGDNYVNTDNTNGPGAGLSVRCIKD